MIRNIFITSALFLIIAQSSALTINRSRRNIDTCGVPKSVMGLVVRGQNFPHGSFPWIVALMHTGYRPPKFFCGGTLISKTFVISAAHCILDKRAAQKFLPRDLLAIFGAHDLNNPYEAGRILQSPKRIFIHEDWNHLTNSFDADISLLEFEADSIQFSPLIQPICLWDSETEPVVTGGVVTGWGKSEDPTKIHENLPKLISAPIQTNEACFLDASVLADLSSLRTFCAGLKNGSGVCSGDSGGGLFFQLFDVYHLKGIVSSSLIKSGDCDISRNAVYTDVLKFRDWIEKIAGSTLTHSTQAFKKISCTFKNSLRTCSVNQTIDSDDFSLGSPISPTVELFDVSYNRDVKFLPRHVGEKLPNLLKYKAKNSGLTVVRDFYFKMLRKLETLNLSSNEIRVIESDSFEDLVNVEMLWIRNNRLETINEKLFVSMTKLELLDLVYNKIKFLSPETFKIPGGKLELIDLQANVCINKIYGSDKYGHKNLEQLEPDLRANCAR